MTLSPEDLARIEAEERARHEVRRRIELEEAERAVEARLDLIDPDKHSLGWSFAFVLCLFAVGNIAFAIWSYFYGSPLRWWAA